MIWKWKQGENNKLGTQGEAELDGIGNGCFLLSFSVQKHATWNVLFFTSIMSTTISIQSKAYMWEGLSKILIRGLLADPIPNSPN